MVTAPPRRTWSRAADPVHDNEHLEAVLRELHADRVRRTIRWDIAKMVANVLTIFLLGFALSAAMERSQEAQDARAEELHRSLNDLWIRVDEISGASVAP